MQYVYVLFLLHGWFKKHFKTRNSLLNSFQGYNEQVTQGFSYGKQRHCTIDRDRETGARVSHNVTLLDDERWQHLTVFLDDQEKVMGGRDSPDAMVRTGGDETTGIPCEHPTARAVLPLKVLLYANRYAMLSENRPWRRRPCVKFSQ
jgi:hypothetical protein